ncbi:hypothetical protein [Ktedonobacter racemifer]|uniref:Uncharacterized protein n=1 Tax=Ktedonobacter racemifer DSM 44963 TaxID=485913 RepID=D6TZ44_KTERA|nr:hypothetical protein [Ktedonobacter racemifer]EFH81834.1 hypothetical protein Krac_2589 [Ktedonobacter racemifer DSM 44963]
MEKVRRLLWNVGLVPNKETFIFVGIALVSCLATLVCGILLAITHDLLFGSLIVLVSLPAFIISFGGSYRLMNWTLSSKEERANIEKEMAVQLLRSWNQAQAEKEDTPERE